MLEIKRNFLCNPNGTSTRLKKTVPSSVFSRHLQDWWIPMDPDGSQWISMDLNGSQWISMDPARSRWIPTGPDGSRRIPTDPNGSRWIPTSPDGSRRILTDPDGSRWIPTCVLCTEWVILRTVSLTWWRLKKR